MTDSWGLFQRRNFVQDHEHTFWIEYAVPIFRHFSLINKNISFSWCESVVSSHTHSQTVSDVWSNASEKLFSDGVARTSEAKVIVRSRLVHMLVKTLFIPLMINSLQSESLRYQNASISTITNSAVFGVQWIRNKITFLKTSLCDAYKWEVVELRSATIPVTWDSKVDLLLVFELVATIQYKFGFTLQGGIKLDRSNSKNFPLLLYIDKSRVAETDVFRCQRTFAGCFKALAVVVHAFYAVCS
ncbi:hypothetical protein EDC94DRAFT_588329 [Helicostylum pulchrum]|nr:hypothetical protein EDC94DRAFT_588329 [Helicostylum pulchrum]